MTRTIFMAASLALAVTLPTVSAQAQSPRTFVSAAGSDSNPCSFALPCRHFQAAVNATSAGGEVDALDPAGYSPITINQAITIEGQGWSYIAPPAGGNGITINAGATDNVVIRGVSLNGAGVSGTTNGIVFNSGGGLTVTNCVIANFVTNGIFNTGNGIFMHPTAAVTFAITNTIIANNGLHGIIFDPPSGTFNVKGIVDHVAMINNNDDGMLFQLIHMAGGSAVLSVSTSLISNNANRGIEADGAAGTATVSIDNTELSNNGTGLAISGIVHAFLGRSVITGNGTDLTNSTSPNTFFSYGNNQFDQSIGTTLNTLIGLQ